MTLLLVRYVLKAAARDRILAALFAIFLAGASLSVFMGSTAVTEKSEFAAVFAGAGMRVAGILGLILFAVSFIRRSFESRDVEFLLSRPISRPQFLLAVSAAFSVLAVITAAMEGLCLYFLAPAHLGPGLVLWTASLAVENVIMINAALFFALTLPSAATGVLVAMGFYIVSRMTGEVLGIIDTGTETGWAHHLTRVMEIISFLLPRLDLMGQTSWLVYGPSGVGYAFLAAQGLSYTGLLLSASIVDLGRRKF